MCPFLSKKIVSKIKRHLPDNLTFQYLLKNRKLLCAEKLKKVISLLIKKNIKVVPILASTDSVIKNNNVYMTLGLKFVLC